MRNYRKYTFEEKQKAVSLYNSGISAPDVAKELNMKRSDTVVDWANKYKKGGELSLKKKPYTYKVKSTKKDFTNMKEKNEYLEAENAYLRLILERVEKEQAQKKSSNLK